nr:probable tocopherol O-methyltransferase, chloroplastic [Tanacetum cinerariifolium]
MTSLYCSACASTLLTTSLPRQRRLFISRTRQPMQRLRRTGGAIRATAVTAEDDMKLKKGIAEFYDE